MSGIFEVTGEDIKLLSDKQLTMLALKLLRLEADKNGIPRSCVSGTLLINAGDGGIDAHIKWDGVPEKTDWIPSQHTILQCKATKMSKANCTKEFQKNKTGAIKPLIDELFKTEGCYILFTGEQCTATMVRDRVDGFNESLKNAGKGYADTAKIEVYDAQKIAEWTNTFVAAVVFVSEMIGKSLPIDVKTWSEWKQSEENTHLKFVPDERRSNAIRDLRTLLSEQQTCARIIGLSGLGKTRLALEVCRDDPSGGFSLSNRVVYLDATYVHPYIPGYIQNWVRNGCEGLIVVDNCELSLHKRIKREVMRQDSKLSLVTLDYNLDEDRDIPGIKLERMNSEYIKKMLEPCYGGNISDLDRIVEFAQGFPQMAVLLSDARLKDVKDMGRLNDQDLLERMLWGGRDENELDLKVLKACSLFDRFGLDDEVSYEFKFIVDTIIGGVDFDDCYECIKKFEERGIIDRRGRYVQVVPKPLAIHLAANWWERKPPRMHESIIDTLMPGQLEESFCKQISKLDFLPKVKKFTENLCGEQGPFGQAEVILSKRGSMFFRALVEVSPAATSEALFRILKIMSESELLEITGDVRRNLVWALEKLCFHSASFEKSVKCLLWLAASENESWSNNATGHFLQLFKIFGSGTEATPEQRLTVIDNALESTSDAIRNLAVRALDSALCTYSGIRIIGAEYQGSGKPLSEWRPKIWKEVFDYLEASLERLTTVVLQSDDLSSLAKESIASHIRDLVGSGRLDVLDEAILSIVNADGPLWPKAIESINDTLDYDSEKMPSEGIIKLNEWVKLLTPDSIKDRITLYITNPHYQHTKGEDGEYIDIAAANAESLAGELSINLSDLTGYIDQLLTDSHRMASLFGRALVVSAHSWSPLLEESISYVKDHDNVNISFLLGLMAGVYEIDSYQWENYVSQFMNSKKLTPYYAKVVCTGKISDAHLANVLKLINSNLLDVKEANVFAYGRALDKFDPSVICKFVSSIKEFNADADWTAFDIIYMYCHGNDERWKACHDEFCEILVSVNLDKEQKDYYHWKSATEKLLNLGDVYFAKAISQKIINNCTDKLDYSTLLHCVKPVVRVLFKNYGYDVWPIFARAIKTSDEILEYRLSQLLTSGTGFDRKELCLLSELPEEVLHKWCKDEVEIAPEFVAQSATVLLADGDDYKISSLAQYIIDEFGDDKNVLNALSINISSFSWSGSVVPYYRKEIAALSNLKKHDKPSVREWAHKRISSLERIIEKELQRDSESEWGLY